MELRGRHADEPRRVAPRQLHARPPAAGRRRERSAARLALPSPARAP